MKIGKLIGQGRTAEIYAVGENDVIKLYRKEMKSEAIEYEFKIAQIVQNAGLNVPKVKELIDIDGRKGIRFERITGNTMLKTMALYPFKLKSLANQFAELHFSIHKCTSYELPRQKDRLRDRIRATDMLSEVKKKIILSYLDELEDGDSICHCDFHPDNIIMFSKAPIIIDWVTCTKGNSKGDVARTILMLKCAQVPLDKPFVEKTLVNGLRKKLLKYYLEEYLRLSNIKLEEIEKWELPVAAARLIEWLPSGEKQALVNIIEERIKSYKLGE